MLRWHRFPGQVSLLIVSFVALGVLALPSVGAANPPTSTPPPGITSAPRLAAPVIPSLPLSSPPACVGASCTMAPAVSISTVAVPIIAQCTFCPAPAGSGPVMQFMPVRDLGIITTETTARFTFDTAVYAQVSLRADNEAPVGVFSHFADETTAATQHDLTLTNLMPWSSYRYTLTFVGETGTGVTGTFATQRDAVTNVRVQPDLTSVQIWFDIAVPADAIVTIRSLYDAYRTDITISQAYRAWLQQPGLKPGTTYKFTITISGQEAYTGTFATSITIDNGPALVPAAG